MNKVATDDIGFAIYQVDLTGKRLRAGYGDDKLDYR